MAGFGGETDVVGSGLNRGFFPKETSGSFWQPRFAYAVVGSGATRDLEFQTNLDGKFATMRA